MCCAFNFAHLARGAAATAGRDSFRAFAHLTFCASAIFRREAADIIRVPWLAFPVGPEPSNDSIAEIVLSDHLPGNLTHPDIQPYLFDKTVEYLNRK